jgi:hypothetical protein
MRGVIQTNAIEREASDRNKCFDLMGATDSGGHRACGVQYCLGNQADLLFAGASDGGGHEISN